MNALDSFGSVQSSIFITASFLLGPLFPHVLTRLPNERNKTLRRLVNSVEDIAEDLLEKAKPEAGEGDKSIIGTLSKSHFDYRFPSMVRISGLVRSESGSSNIHMSIDEIVAQVR